jgi:hypothetical protein
VGVHTCARVRLTHEHAVVSGITFFVLLWMGFNDVQYACSRALCCALLLLSM